MKTMKFWALCLAAVLLPAGFSTTRAVETTPAPKPNANLELARQLNEAFVGVAESVSPAVVVITVRQKPSANRLNDLPDDPDDPMGPLRRYFQQRQPDATRPPQSTTGQGSGIIIRADGYILTNEHVVEDAERITVRLKDGREFPAEVKGFDAPADVAVIKINTNNLVVARLADSDKTRVGEFAIAIGAPFALDYSVTFGHVSAKNRTDVLTAEDYEKPVGMLDQEFIQTDANINPGNSGGPLINIEGEVIGINTLIRGMHTGIGFAIPINLAREVADGIIADGHFKRPWLGVGIASLRDFDRRTFVKGVTDGVLITSIVEDGPVAHSELRKSDVVTSVDGRKVITAQELKDAIRSKKVGQNVTLDVFRQGTDKPLKVVVKPGEWVQPVEVAANIPEVLPSDNALGIKVKALTPDLARRYGAGRNGGMMVTHVDHHGLAGMKGIQAGDIITTIDQKRVTTMTEFLQALHNADTAKGVTIQLISDGVAKTETLKEGK